MFWSVPPPDFWSKPFRLKTIFNGLSPYGRVHALTAVRGTAVPVVELLVAGARLRSQAEAYARDWLSQNGNAIVMLRT
jgi:hypothetical protein